MQSFLALTLLAGCGSDGHGKGIGSLGDDDSSSGDSSGSGTSASASASSGGGTGGLSGDYLLVVSATLSPLKPIVFLAEVDAATSGSMTMAVVALSAADRTTPVGETFMVGPLDVEADGTFQATLPSVDLPGEANPISGSDLTGVNAVVTATASAPFVCGDVSGEIAAPPVSLNGSTFTLLQITDPNAWPEVIIDCAGTEAAPLGE